MAAQPLRQRKPMDRTEFAAAHGADPDDLAEVEKFAQEHHLVVVKKDRGPAGGVAVRDSWRTSARHSTSSFRRVRSSPWDLRGRTGPVYVPAELAVVAAVLGLDDRPQANPRFQVLQRQGGFAAARAGSVSFSPDQVAKLYDFPRWPGGMGQCIGIIEPGWRLPSGRSETYFKRLGIPVPNVSAVSVDHGHNSNLVMYALFTGSVVLLCGRDPADLTEDARQGNPSR